MNFNCNVDLLMMIFRENTNTTKSKRIIIIKNNKRKVRHILNPLKTLFFCLFQTRRWTVTNHHHHNLKTTSLSKHFYCVDGDGVDVKCLYCHIYIYMYGKTGRLSELLNWSNFKDFFMYLLKQLAINVTALVRSLSFLLIPYCN